MKCEYSHSVVNWQNITCIAEGFRCILSQLHQGFFAEHGCIWYEAATRLWAFVSSFHHLSCFLLCYFDQQSPSFSAFHFPMNSSIWENCEQDNHGEILSQILVNLLLSSFPCLDFTKLIQRFTCHLCHSSLFLSHHCHLSASGV